MYYAIYFRSTPECFFKVDLAKCPEIRDQESKFHKPNAKNVGND